MKALDPRRVATEAVSTRPERPATAIVHDSPDVRLIVFRLSPGQEVPRHQSPATVLLQVLEGDGLLLGPGDEARACAAGDIVAFEPHEPHGMRATGDTLVVLATITPRPGTR